MKRYTPLQYEYAKQRKRIKQAIKRQEKIGYIIPENILPKVPKRLTKASVRKLEKITPEYIRKKSEYIIEENGKSKLVKYSRHKKKVKEEIKKIRKKKKLPHISYVEIFKEKLNRAIQYVNTFKSEILDLPDERVFYRGKTTTFMSFSEHKNVIISLLDDRIAEVGEIEIEKILKQNENRINTLLEDIQMDSDQNRVEMDFIEIANIIKGTYLTRNEATEVADMTDFDYN